MKQSQTKTNQPTADERVKMCGEEIHRALTKHNCQMYSALRIGNADTPLVEIGGLPIVVKLTANDNQKA